ncbi:hypothetical protein ThvES_00017420 [Thiovulum sp. ES]|nr:hypothetical protein ThvES_00017420 [Thiovulum sp. ES]
MYKIFSLLAFVLIFEGCNGGIFSRVGNGVSGTIAQSKVSNASENIKKSEKEIKVLKRLRKEKLNYLVKFIEIANGFDKLAEEQTFLKKYLQKKSLKKLSDGERRKAFLSYRLVEENFIKSSLELQSFVEDRKVKIRVKNGFQIEKNHIKLYNAVSSEIGNFLNFSNFIKFETEPKRVSLSPPTYQLNFSSDEKEAYKEELRKYNKAIARFNYQASLFNWSLEKDKRFFHQNLEESHEKIDNFTLKVIPKALGNLSLEFGRFYNGYLSVILYSTKTDFQQKFLLNVNNRSSARDLILDFKNGENSIEVEFWKENENLKFEFSKFEIGGKNLIGYINRDGAKFSRNLYFGIPKKVKYSLSAIPEKTLESIADESFDNDLRKDLERKDFATLDSKKWLVVIGVENYEDLGTVPFSVRSSLLLKDTFHKLLGVPKNQILTAIGENATEKNILKIFTDLQRNIERGDTIYFYYSGHGIPSQNGALLTAKDSEATSMVKGVSENSDELKLRNIYQKLQKTRAKKVVTVIDSCFSGSAENENGKEEDLLGGRGLASSFVYVKPSTKDFEKLKIITAGGEKDFSNSYEIKGHRLFTYFLLKEVIDGERDLDEIFSETKESVVEKSTDKGEGYIQTPTAENLEDGDKL